MLTNNDTKTRIAVLEQKSITQERLIEKVEDAIQVMKDVVENVSKMLAVHDERIEQCGKTDDMISRMLNELKDGNRDQHAAVSERIDKIEVKLEEIIKYRWIVVGIFAVCTFAFSQSGVVIDFLTPDNSQQITVEKK